MKTSRDGLAFIKQWEGCRLKSYQDSAKVWTIGYGITSAAGFGPITQGMTITQAQADEWLVAGLEKYEAAVTNALKRNPTQNQFDAMVSLCWNIGPGAFAGSSVVRRFNEGDVTGASGAFLMWRKAGGKVLPGLTNRRKAEVAMFMKVPQAETAPPVAIQPPPDVEVVPKTPPVTKPWKPTVQATTAGGIIMLIIYAIMAMFGIAPSP